MPAPSGRLVPLTTEVGDAHEVTVYVKGFLASGERPERFDLWHAGHRTLESSHGWGPRAFGWTWSSGSWSAVPIPVVSGAKVVADVYRFARLGRMGPLGLTLGVATAEIATRFLVQYLAACRSAVVEAEHLAARLEELASRHERVRVMAHSLGCRQVIEAVARLPRSLRPHEIHLCAPACAEADVAAHLGSLAQEKTYLYFTRADLVLAYAFPLVAQTRALGAFGPRVSYPGLTQIDVSEHFGFFVHNDYKNRFHKFAGRAQLGVDPLDPMLGSVTSPLPAQLEAV